MHRSQRQDLVAGGVILATSAFFVWQAMQLPESGRGSASLNPRTIPLTLLGLIMVLAIVVMARSPRSQPAESAEEPDGEPDPFGLRRTVAMVALLVLYAVLLQYVGLVASTVVFVVGALVLLAQRLLTSLLVSLAYAAALYLVFVVLLGVRFDTDLLSVLHL